MPRVTARSCSCAPGPVHGLIPEMEAFELFAIDPTLSKSGKLVFCYRHRATGLEYEFYGNQPSEAELMSVHKDAMTPEGVQTRLILSMYYGPTPVPVN